MRDPRRISALMEALEAAWEREPDIRLGQLICNAAVDGGSKLPRGDVFSVEDDIVLKGLMTMQGL